MPHNPDDIAKGVGLIAAGHSVRWVQETTGIPKSTLHDAYLKHLGPDAADKDEQRRLLDERITARAGAIAELTTALMAQRLEDGNYNNRDLTAWHEAAIKSYGKLRGWDKGVQTDDTANQFAQVVDKILSNGGASLNLTITPIDREPEREVVDVESSE
jgi:hypothetical protein